MDTIFLDLVSKTPPEVYTGGALALLISAASLYFFFIKPANKNQSVDLTDEASPKKFDKIEENQINVIKPKIEDTPKTMADALSATQKTIWGRMVSVFSKKPLISESDLDEIEEVLYTSDLGPKTVQLLSKKISDQIKINPELNVNTIREVLRSEMLGFFNQVGMNSLEESENLLGRLKLNNELTVWMIVGVNGAGKTTTIGKLASKLASQGKKVLVAAGDTFRAAADEQLKVWSQKASVEIFSPEGIKDPSAVAFDALNMAKANVFDVVILDTAGRLHTQKNLMEELKKVKRVMAKVIADAPHETLLVLDGSMGQNALIQADEFNQALEITGVVLTKMDGTSKGGVAVGIAAGLNLPVKMIGVGEGIDDLRPFKPLEFIHSII